MKNQKAIILDSLQEATYIFYITDPDNSWTYNFNLGYMSAWENAAILLKINPEEIGNAKLAGIARAETRDALHPTEN